jgi:Ca2+/H+ antiporter
VVLAVAGILGPLKQTYEEKYDRFGNLFVGNALGIVYLALPCLVLAVAFHP